MTPDRRAAAVRQEMTEMDGQVRRLPGGAAVFAAPVVAQIAALIAFVNSEMASSDRIIGAKYEALFRVLTAKGCRVARDDQRGWGTASLGFQHDVDPETAARALGMKADTMRKYLRRGIIQGHKVGPKWRVPLSSIEEYRKKAVA